MERSVDGLEGQVKVDGLKISKDSESDSLLIGVARVADDEFLHESAEAELTLRCCPEWECGRNLVPEGTVVAVLFFYF